ncbi:MAG: hypothetical protein CMQ43_07555 [Gammaproteobacteria bacterium]|nr:hypothetical protein [Gammaproteobacteria bacterium]
MTDPIIESFEVAAERAGDITDAVYRRYYDRSPEAQRLMQHVDQHMQGRMMNEVLGLLMTPEADLPDHYLEFETRNHAAYGVDPGLYRPLFESVRDEIRAAVGGDWTPDLDAAWASRVDALDARFRDVAPKPALLAGRG